jgi:two-component system, OmpR family, KDP operon response regulator KdpE
MASNAANVLVVDDEVPIRRFLHASLTGAGYQVREAQTGEQGVRMAAEQPPDLVILDLGLPDLDGLEVLSRLREWLHAPIVILSARDQEVPKVAALDAGADDYLTKPFGTAELLARIRALLRRRSEAMNESSKVQYGDFTMDFAARSVEVGGVRINLTPIEYKLLAALVRNAGKVITHRQLLREIWGPDHAQETHYLRVFMAALRRKIESEPARPQRLLTEQGVGYRFQADFV